MYSLTFSAYCGMNWEVSFGDLEKCRLKAARILRSRKADGHFIHKIKENVWECQEPENSFMVPDTAGILSLKEVVEENDFNDEEFNEIEE